MNILYISASPRGLDSDSYLLSHYLVTRLRRRAPDAKVTERRLWQEYLPQVDAIYALALAGEGGELGSAALARSDLLIEELEAADVLVIATPMHNLTVPSALKAWIDHVVRAHRTMRITPAGKVGALADRPVFIVISSGGQRTGAQARQPDFLEPYLRAVLAMIGLHDVAVFSLESTVFGGNRRSAYASVDAWFDGTALETVRLSSAA